MSESTQPTVSESPGRFSLRSLLLGIAVAALLIRLFLFILAVLDPRTRLVGRVVFDESNKPAAGVSVYAIALGSEDVVVCKTNANGRFQFPPVAAKANYRVLVRDRNWAAPASEVIPGKSGELEVPGFRLTRGAKVQIQIEEAAHTDQPASLRLGAVGDRMGNYQAFMDIPTSNDEVVKLRLSPGQHMLEVNGAQQKLIVEEGDDFFIFLDPQELTNRTEFNAGYYRNPANGHYYRKIEADVGWQSAVDAAAKHTFRDIQGHLVTITSQQENDFLVGMVGSDRELVRETYAAATDVDEEGVWKWVCGPEAGHVFYREGEKLDAYHNWDRCSARLEPNEEDYLLWHWPGQNGLPGRWIDWNGRHRTRYYIVEFSPAKTMAPPKAKPATPGNPSDNPRLIDFAYVNWNDSWIVHGFVASEGKWYSWESPATRIPAVPVFAHRENQVAALVGSGRKKPVVPHGWLLDIASNRWTEIPPVSGVVAGRVDFLGFVGEKLVAVIDDQVGNGCVAVLDTSSMEWTTNRTAPRWLGRSRYYIPFNDKLVISGQFWLWAGVRIEKPDRDGLVYDVVSDSFDELQLPKGSFSGFPIAATADGLVFRSDLQKHVLRLGHLNLTTGDWDELNVPSWLTAPPPNHNPLPPGGGVAGMWRGERFTIQAVVSKNKMLIADKKGESGVYDFDAKTWRQNETQEQNHGVLTRVNGGRALLYRGIDQGTSLVSSKGAIFEFATKTWKGIELPTRPTQAVVRGHGSGN